MNRYLAINIGGKIGQPTVKRTSSFINLKVGYIQLTAGFIKLITTILQRIINIIIRVLKRLLM